ncbi:MAG: hemerythrin domain-containing protein [Acidobacteria bacterium]|nr:hemerythrin domain-containing protein [Acidobacteriota bacterium]MBI3657659.1 hemerythrin domain-containing protein [Acidobacteriota bacterium]
MHQPIRILDHEHRIIERILRALEGLCTRLVRGENPPAAAFLQIIDFFRTFADSCHHQKEEKYLFPVLEQHGVPRVGGPVGVMLYEHEMGRRFVADLASAVAAYEKGDPSARAAIVENGRGYIRHLAEHINKEDNILYKMAEDMFDDATWTALLAAFEKTEESVGACTHEKCERQAAELENSWALLASK